MTKYKMTIPKPGQESVWDYPRPPRLEPVHKRLEVHFGGQRIADTRRGYRVLETSHPPGYYFPVADVLPTILLSSEKSTVCEWKGKGYYYHVQSLGHWVENAAWYYAHPRPTFMEIQGYVSFYPGLMDACYVDGERVIPQEGNFYGGWITQNLTGPFKGVPGSSGW